MRYFFFLIIYFFSFFYHGQAATRINHSLALGEVITSAQFSPLTNSSRLIYTSFNFNTSAEELFSVDFRRGPFSAVSLSGPKTSNFAPIFDFLISPDGSRVVFLERHSEVENKMSEIYSIPIEGGIATKVNGPLITGGACSEFDISPDGNRVVYVARQDTINQFELYSVAITGGPTVKLNTPFAPFNGFASVVDPFKISPDSSRVVYHADQDTNFVFELYSVPITGGANTKLNSPLVLSGDVTHYNISPDSSHVVYRADQDTNDFFELYSIPIAGGAVTKLNNPQNGQVDNFFIEISPDSSRVVYVAETNFLGKELYSVPLAGGVVTKLNAPFVPGSGLDSQQPFEISSDSSRVIYLADQNTNGVMELFSVPLMGGVVTQLNSTLVLGGNVIKYQISADNSRVVYDADQDVDQTLEIYNVPLIGGAVTKLNGPFVPGGGFTGVDIISPDSSRVLYTADQDTLNVFELYSAPITGGAVTKVNGPLVTDGDLYPFFAPQFHPSGNPLIYIADQDTDEVQELYVTLNLPIITSPTNVFTLVKTNFSYTITATNGPILGFGATNLPNWATFNSNVITGIPDVVSTYTITLFATNSEGVNGALLTLHVSPTNSVVESSTGFSGDFDGDRTLDLLAQKKTKVTLIAFKMDGVDVNKTVTLNKKEKVVGANVVNSNNALIVQNKTTISAVLVGSNFIAGSRVDLGAVSSSKEKVMASGDVNGDGVVDIVTQKGKMINALLSPGYTSTTLVKTKKSKPKVVGLLSRIGTTNSAVSSLILAKGKRLFFYDIPTNAPFIEGEANLPQVGPVFQKAYRVVGATAGTNTATARLILTKGKKVGIVNYGANSLGTPIFQTTKKLGKIVGPQ